MSTPRCRARICRSIGSPPNVPQTLTRRTERQLLQLADDLLRQFAGRRQDHGLRPASSGFEHFDDGYSKRRGLAGARLGLADDIESIERLGYEGRLNGAGGKVADVLEGLEHARAQAHGREPDSGFRRQLVESINPPETIVCEYFSTEVADRAQVDRTRAVTRPTWKQ